MLPVWGTTPGVVGFMFIWVLTLLSAHCTGHITMGSCFMGRGNQYIQLVKVLYCKLPNNSKQLPAFLLEVGPGIKLRSQMWEARLLPLRHRGPLVLYEQLLRDREGPNYQSDHLQIHKDNCSTQKCREGSVAPISRYQGHFTEIP